MEASFSQMHRLFIPHKKIGLQLFFFTNVKYYTNMGEAQSLILCSLT